MVVATVVVVVGGRGGGHEGGVHRGSPWPWTAPAKSDLSVVPTTRSSVVALVRSTPEEEVRR